MFRSKTALVVGAGASCEAKFPDGQGLLKEIRKILDIRFEMGNRLNSGDYKISEALRDLMPDRQYGADYNKYLAAAWRIRDASILGLSIDNIIEQHDDDDRVAICGKLAILRSILQAERDSLLMPPRDRPDSINIGALAHTWYGRFGQILVENIPRRRAKEVFENLSIICFNYDRALQHFLPFSLATSWGITLDEARELTKSLRIMHPYGRVSSLPWEVANGGVSFGGTENAQYAGLVEQIRTFSERIDDAVALAQIRNTLTDVDQVIFLGFAFHAPNMDIIRPADSGAERVLATVYNLPENEQRQIERQIRGMFNLPEGVEGLVLHNGTCSDLFRENWRTISA
ncbi:hypothetical protein [Sphingopyxis sp. QXT-31]|uniref:hypothetical protein n=1 Tax=Sphingopyxis sp. QXT-31 TaxID=1357916 RepID=UPI0012ECA641|nr:hypothetical protein [Sphingopyxis sp. QXT-31]